MKINIKFIASVILIALFAAGFYFVVSQKKVPITSATDDWKTYTNEKYGFEFKYPASKYTVLGYELSSRYYKDEYEVGVYPIEEYGEYSGTGLGISIRNLGKTPVKLEELINYRPLGIDNTHNTKKILVGGQEAVRVDHDLIQISGYDGQQSIFQSYVYFIKNNLLYTINIEKDSVDLEKNISLEEILSSFEFTDPTTDVSNWKTYSGYGISFKYPSSMGEPKITQLSTMTSFSFSNSVEFDIGVYYDQNFGRNKTFDEVVNKAKNNPEVVYRGEKDITVGNKTGVELFLLDKVSGGESVEIYVPNIDKHGNMLSGSEYNRAVANVGGADLLSIMKTLEFTEPATQIDTSNWKTYKNEDYGIEFKYLSTYSILDRSYITPGGGVFPSVAIVPPTDQENDLIIIGSRTLVSTAPAISCNSTFTRCKEFGSNIVYTKAQNSNIQVLFDNFIDTVKFTK
ncbi:MAG: hypothetical protein NTZ87_02080 [Candidatus Nomurabacteria bacterium]|nr:hypothetical protein [Candidatus Nomurabacteria bacterium]